MPNEIVWIQHSFTAGVWFLSSYQTEADKRFLFAKGSVPIGIGKNSHVKRAIIDKNARIGENVKVLETMNLFSPT